MAERLARAFLGETARQRSVVSGDVGNAPPLKHGVTNSLQRRGRRKSGELHVLIHPPVLRQNSLSERTSTLKYFFDGCLYR
jgi:hypothetical protein